MLWQVTQTNQIKKIEKQRLEAQFIKWAYSNLDYLAIIESTIKFSELISLYFITCVLINQEKGSREGL